MIARRPLAHDKIPGGDGLIPESQGRARIRRRSISFCAGGGIKRGISQ